MFIKVLFLDKNGASFVDIENSLEGFKALLGWDDSWNTPTIHVWNNDFICICADTGKVQHWPISAITMNNFFNDEEQVKEPFIVGNIIITKFDGTDDFCSLTEHDIELLRSRLYSIPAKIPSKDFYKTLLILD